MVRYIFNFLITIDQFANTILLGDPDETLSSRMGKHIRKNQCGLCKIICKLLDLVDKGHCINSIEEDEGDRQLSSF